MSVTRDDLLAVIAENPNDESAWLLYADWLQQHGEPRGELIALETAADDRKRELEVARVALIASYSEQLLGVSNTGACTSFTVTLAIGRTLSTC